MLRWLIVLCLSQIALSKDVEVVNSKQSIQVRYDGKKMKVKIPIIINRRLEPIREDDMSVQRNKSLIDAINVTDVCVSNLKNNVNVGYNDIHSRKRDLSDYNNESLNPISEIALNKCNTKRWLNLNPRKVTKRPKKGKPLEGKRRRKIDSLRRQSDYMASINDMALMKHLKKIRKKSRRDDREEELQYDLDDEELYIE